MSNVTQQPGGCIDIWPYVRMIQASVELPQQVMDGQFVEYVYRSQFNHYDHASPCNRTGKLQGVTMLRKAAKKSGGFVSFTRSSAIAAA